MNPLVFKPILCFYRTRHITVKSMLKIPLKVLAKTAYEKFMEVAGHEWLGGLLRYLDRPFFEELALACLDDEINFRMCWAKTTNRREEIINRLEWDHSPYQSLDWLDAVIDQWLVNPIDDRLNGFVLVGTWDILDLKYEGGVMSIESLGDYRILEWERLMLKYEPKRYRFYFLETGASPARRIVLPLRTMAREGYSYWFKKKGKEEDLSSPITLEQFQTLTLKIIEDQLTSRMVWARSSFEMDDFLQSEGLYDLYCASLTFYQAIERIIVRIESFLRGLLSEATWEVWEALVLEKTGAVQLVRLNDYRILDYPRLKDLEDCAQRKPTTTAYADSAIGSDSVPY